MYRILVVEDDPSIAELMEMNFSVAGYLCDVAADGKQALDRVKEKAYDLAILDIMLPEIDGFSLLPYMKKAEIPVIYVSAKNQEADRVKGLRLGAEDYLVKPFRVLELLVRMEKVLERRHPKQERIEIGNVSILPEERTVLLAGNPVSLKPMEYALLLMLAKHPNIVFSREQLLQEVWGDSFFGETRTVDNHIAMLRKKLEWAERIVTVHRVGYKLVVD